jgi:hypothetical protein
LTLYLNCELEAYCIGAHYGAVLHFSGDERYKDKAILDQWKIEAIREDFASSRYPFYANRQIKIALAEATIDLLRED